MRELAERLVGWGRADGADEIEVSVVEGREFSVEVRRGRIESLVEADSRVLGLRITKDKRTAVASSSDLGPGTLRRLVRNAVRRAELAEPDPFAGLAPLTPSTVDPDSLKLYDPEVPTLDPQKMIGLALETERIALADKRITNSYGAGFSSDDARVFLANSNGFSNGYSGTYCGSGSGSRPGPRTRGSRIRGRRRKGSFALSPRRRPWRRKPWNGRSASSGRARSKRRTSPSSSSRR